MFVINYFNHDQTVVILPNCFCILSDRNSTSGLKRLALKSRVLGLSCGEIP